MTSYSLEQAKRRKKLLILANPVAAKMRTLRKAGKQEGLVVPFSWTPVFLRWPFPYSAE
jgi:hypothetical protein